MLCGGPLSQPKFFQRRRWLKLGGVLARAYAPGLFSGFRSVLVKAFVLLAVGCASGKTGTVDAFAGIACKRLDCAAGNPFR